MSSLAQQNFLDYSSEVIEDKSLKTNNNKKQNYDESYKIIKFEKTVTVREALNWLKNIMTESAFEKNGSINFDQETWLGNFKDYYDAIFNNNDHGTKVYKNSTRWYKIRRFESRKVNYFVINDDYNLNNWHFESLYDEESYNKLLKMIKDGKKIGRKIKVEMMVHSI